MISVTPRDPVLGVGGTGDGSLSERSGLRAGAAIDGSAPLVLLPDPRVTSINNGKDVTFDPKAIIWNQCEHVILYRVISALIIELHL